MYKALVIAAAVFAVGCQTDGAAQDPVVDGGVDAGQVSDGSLADDGSAPDAAADMGLPRDGGGDPLVPETTSGPVQGFEADGYAYFLGIPYAAPPVGDLRLRPPQAPAPWAEPFAADTLGAECPQLRDEQVVGDEDCLSLNVWRPAGADDLPVMVFIHGGAFIQGSSAVELYDGSDLATAGDVVVVTLNYRLGALGFLATEALIAEDARGSAGNLGIEDQQLALRWVRDNIAAFGGDPNQVTIFGESAGGASVCVHLGAPESAGLFHRGIIESGGGCSGWRYLDGARPTATAVERGAEIVEAAGCRGADELACLRGLSTEEMVRATWSASSSGLGLPDVGPNVDGVVITDQTVNHLRNGTAPDVPVITGSNADESRSFVSGIPVPTEAAFEAALRALLPGAIVDDVMALYPVDAFDSPKLAFEAVYSDIAFICPTLAFAAAAADGEPSYVYHFVHTLSGLAARAGTPHGAELLFIFDGINETLAQYNETAADRRVVAAFQDAWAGFAHGDVPQSGDVIWPAYGEAAELTLLADPVTVTASIRQDRCAALAQLGLVGGG